MRISDVCLAFPGLVFALAIAALLGGGISNAVIALAVISWPKYARVARGQTLALKNCDFLAAARLAGDNSVQMIWRHILPNILGPILVTAMLDIGTMMMELAGLSFLGLGAQPPVPEWGNMMSGGRSMLQTYPWLVLSPGVAIFLTVVTFNLLGDTVRDYMDPKNSGSQ
jgi:peptide/nickel transport system permease protein